MGPVWMLKHFFFVRSAPSLNPGESVCVAVTMNYGSQWKGRLWIMLMKSAAITQISFDRTFQS